MAVCLFLLLTGSMAYAENTDAENMTDGLQHDLLVIFTSDVHCGVAKNFGYAGLQAIRDAAQERGDHVMLVDDGDSIQGEPIGILTRGEALLDLMNVMKYDVAIPGNHEFDYGMERFLELAQKAEFPYISCNFRKNEALVFDPYVIKEFDGVKFAFVGATTPQTLTSSTPRYFQDEDGNYIYDFTQDQDGSAFIKAVQKAVDDARAEGADYVFLMGHLGEEASCAPYTYVDVIGKTNGIDAMLDGHSHDTDKVVMKNKDGKEVIRQACGTKLNCIGWLRMSAEDGSLDTGLYSWTNNESVGELLGIENEADQKVKEAITSVNEKLKEKVGAANVDLFIDDPTAVDGSGQPVRIARRAETNIGDLLADAFRDRLGADIGLMNGGALRSGIKRGEITLNELLTVNPFSTHVVKIEVTGQQLLDALEFGASVVPEESGGFLQVSGVTYEIHTYIDSTCAHDENGMFAGVKGEYRVKNVLVNGEKLDLEKNYTIAGVDYTLLNHGDGQTAFDGGKILEDTGVMDYEVVREYIRETLGGIVGDGYEDPYGQGRIVAVEEPNAD